MNRFRDVNEETEPEAGTDREGVVMGVMYTLLITLMYMLMNINTRMRAI